MRLSRLSAQSLPYKCVLVHAGWLVVNPYQNLALLLTPLVPAGIRPVHGSMKANQPCSPVHSKGVAAQDSGYGYVCQSCDCSGFYEVPGLKKSKAE